ncbi:hypothetical protein ACFSNO_30285 [Streptomyces cirratus]
MALVRPDTLAGDAMPVLLNAGLRANQGAGLRRHTGGRGRRRLHGRGPEALTDTTGPAAKDRGCVTAVRRAHGDLPRRVPPAPTRKRKKPQIASVLGSVSQALVDRTGGRESPFEGAYLTSWYPVSGDPLWGPMRKVISERAFGDDTVDPDDSGTQTTWIAYTVLSEIVGRLKADEDVTARKIAKALNQTAGVQTGGLTPELSWRDQDVRAVAGFPRISNGRVTFQVVQQGRLVAQPGEEPQDMTPTLEAAPRAA